MKRTAPDDPLGIRAEVERERLKSRYRDRNSLERVHPIQHDVNMILAFIIVRRRRSAPAAFDAARRVLRAVDTSALRVVVSTVLDGGQSDRTTKRRCARILGYCTTIETALALKGRTK